MSILYHILHKREIFDKIPKWGFFIPGVVGEVIHIFAESTSSANKKSLGLGILIRCFEIKYAPVYSYFLDLGYISCSNPSVIDSHKKSKFYFYFGPSFCPGSVDGF